MNDEQFILAIEKTRRKEIENVHRLASLRRFHAECKREKTNPYPLWKWLIFGARPKLELTADQKNEIDLKIAAINRDSDRALRSVRANFLSHGNKP